MTLTHWLLETKASPDIDARNYKHTWLLAAIGARRLVIFGIGALIICVATIDHISYTKPATLQGKSITGHHITSSIPVMPNKVYTDQDFKPWNWTTKGSSRAYVSPDLKHWTNEQGQYILEYR